MKTAIKRAKPSPRNGNRLPISPGSHGGGKKGRSGRRPDVVKQLAAEIADCYQLLPMLAEMAADKREKTNDRISAARVVLEHTHQKPMQTVEHTGEVLNVHEYRQTFESRMGRLFERIGTHGLSELAN